MLRALRTITFVAQVAAVAVLVRALRRARVVVRGLGTVKRVFCEDSVLVVDGVNGEGLPRGERGCL